MYDTKKTRILSTMNIFLLLRVFFSFLMATKRSIQTESAQTDLLLLLLFVHFFPAANKQTLCVFYN